MKRTSDNPENLHADFYDPNKWYQMVLFFENLFWTTDATYNTCNTSLPKIQMSMQVFEADLLDIKEAAILKWKINV